MDFFSLMFIIITYSFNNVSSKIIIDTINTNISWLYLTKFYFHPIYGQIDISLYSLENTIRFFVLNKQEWIEIKNDLSNICLKNELKLNRTKNETNLWSLSSSFTSIGQMHFILSKCNSSLNTTDLPFTYKLVLTNGDNLFMKHFSDDERGILPLFIVSTCIYSILLFIVVRYTSYIDPTLSKTHIQDLLTREKEVTTASCELTDLYSIGNANKSKLRMPLKSFETFRRLEPRRDVLLSPSLQSCIVSIQPSVNPISPPLITTEA
ncbi:unnamed protein product [Rotaria socialis]|uniref:Uncharacterized protein n=1 Tax=Rotaria socialis TaxID=392032 RepID=A0A820INE2_9BILA|nr:unnamed protein product [Rotaria socialis]